jgi:hypothetical protein
MPNWKKLIVSGSDASLNSLNVTTNVTAQSFTGSFSGSITHAVSASYAVTASYALNAADSVWTGSGANIYYNLGNVGIGTTSPSYKLDVNGIGNFSNGFSDPSSETGYRLKFYDNGGIYNDAGIGLDGSGGGFEIMWFNALEGFYWGVGTGGTKMKLNNSGNLGIGTTSPSQILETYKSTNGDVAIQVTNPNAGASATAQFFASNGTTQTQFFHTGTSYNGTGILASSAGLGGIYNNTAQGIALLASSAAGPIRFGTTTSNTERMRIASDGNVGIGTTSPSSTLQVSKGGVTFQITDTNKTANSTFSIYGYSQTAFAIATGNSGSFGGGEKIIITDGGNIGIGTTNPTGRLEVFTSSDNQLRLDASGTYSAMYLTQNQAVKGAVWMNHGSLGMFVGTTVSNGFLALGSDNSTEKVRITAAGNVGIGTTAPSSILDTIVSSGGTSGVRFRGFSDASTPYLLSLGTYSYPDHFQINSVNGLVTMGIVGATGANPDLAFQTNTTERMRIATGGNIGIGSTAPSATLDILTGASDSTGNSFSFTGYGSKTYVSISKLGFIRTRASDLNGANMHFLDNGGTNRIEIAVNTTSMTWYSHALSTDFLVFQHTTGNVGIGYTSPTQKLSVAGAISVSGSVIDYEVAPALISPGPGSNIVSFTPGTHYAAFVDYVIKDGATGANQRVGTIMVSISLAGASAVMNEVATLDIGNTSAITFSVTYGAPTWLVAANSGITPYDISYMVRYF